jgi:hypothetical protein
MSLFNSKHYAGESFVNDCCCRAQYLFSYIGLRKSGLTNNFKAVFKHLLIIAFTSIALVSSAFAVPAPTISSISPNVGSLEDSTTVIITGTNFTGATAVTFGGDAADTFTVNSAAQITATAPMKMGPGMSSEVVNVVITTPGGPVTSVGAFTYVGHPMISTLSPNSGSAAGGTTVIITGGNYIGVTAVDFGGVAAASYTVNSDTQITAVTPAGMVGISSIGVNAAGGYDSWYGGYTYVTAGAVPTVTSATYDASAGALVVTGTNFTAIGGATNDVIANKFTFTGEGGSTYTLTDTANVEISSATSFTLTLSATDRAAVNLIVNKNGASSTSGTTYNLAGATGFIAAAVAAADFTGNGVTVSNVAIPKITSATYNASTSTFIITGTDFLRKSGSSNDIDATKFSFRGEGGSGSTYTFIDTSSVDITSSTSFTLVLGSADTNAINLIADKNGTSSVSGSAFLLNGVEDWAAGADSAVTTADPGNSVTVSNVAVPAITSATYNVSTGVLVVTGTGFLRRSGFTNDIVANKFTLTGQGGSTYTLTDTANVEVTSTTSFTLTLSSTDNAAVSTLLNKNGTSSTGGTTYNLSAAEDWAGGADSAVVVVDLTGNGITVSNALSAPNAPTIGTATAGDSQASVTFTAPGSNGGSAITTYTATASPGGAFGTCAGPAACTATVTGLNNGTAYTFTVTATNAIGTSTASGTSNSATPKGNQTITFNNPGAQNFGTTPALTATAPASGLTPTFTSSTTGVCTITSGGALTFVTAGSCTIDADQAGNTAWNAATTVTQTFTVNAIPPGAPTIGTATAGDTQATVTFTAPASMGGAAIIASGYTVTANPGGANATGSSSPITVTGLTNGVSYTFTVTATNSAGEGNPSAASNSIIPAAPQAITFGHPGTQNFGTTPTLTATSSAGGGYPVSFTSSTTGVCTITSGGTLTFVTTGSCTINANQAGDSSYLAAPQVGQTFTVVAVVPGAPTAATATAGETQASVAFTAPTFIGGAAITGYTVTSNPANVGGPVSGASSPIVVTGLTNGVAYTFTVTATSSAGTGAASAASNSITPAASQTITFAAPSAQTFGTTPTFTATADSGLTPTFTSVTPAVCTITGLGALTFVTAGNCTINADQAGNGSYLPAPQVSRTFAVNAVLPGIPTMGTATAGSAQASVAFTAPSFTGGVAITSYTVTSNPGGATASGSSSPITVTGLSNGTSYTFTVKATNSVGTSSPSAASGAVTPMGTQTIIFAAPATQSLGNALTVVAITSSGLSPTFTSSSLGVCTVTASGVVTLVTPGTCTLNADQIGNTTFLPAPTVTRSFGVTQLPNSVPVINQGSSTTVTMSEDGTPTAFALSLTATDGDNDTLSWSILGAAQHGSASVVGGVVSYTPSANYNGSDSFIVQVSDGEGAASITVNVTVTPVNDIPVISGVPVTSVKQDVAYSFTPTASDIDTADTLTFSIVNKPTWATFNTATGVLSGAPSKTDVATTAGIVISVSDGTASASLPAFAIEVVSTVDPLQPIVTAPADLDINATALFTPVTLSQLLGMNSSATQAEIDLVLKAMASDGVSGNSCCTTNPEGLNANNSLLLAPGRHEVKWKATNAMGVTGEATQVINLKPLISLSRSQIALRGSAVNFKVILNGRSPTYPLSVPYVIDASTSATSAEHNLINGVASFTQEGQVEVVIPVSLKAVSGVSDSQLVIALGDGINAGVANRHTISLREGNIPPVVNMVIRQGGVATSLITPNGGAVTVSVNVSDANSGDTHTFDWSATSGLADTDGNPVNASRVFDPAGLSGSHQVQVIVMDSAGAAVQAQAYFRVIASLPILSADTDTDKDGIDDDLEGSGDSDNNGIPDYLDNMPSPNILPQTGNVTNAYLIECDPGVRCGLGLFARASTSGGVQILDSEISQLNNLIVDPAFKPVGGVFDFVIRDLPTLGQSVRVVIPQQAPIPENPVYRKFQKGQWVNFISNTDNAIHSTAGNPGYCPPPGSAEWQLGLTPGHLCVQLTLQDGGPNDDDGQVNSAVVDPGAVSTALPVDPPIDPPVQPPMDVEVKAKRGGAMGEIWLLALAGLLLLRRANAKLGHRF